MKNAGLCGPRENTVNISANSTTFVSDKRIQNILKDKTPSPRILELIKGYIRNHGQKAGAKYKSVFFGNNSNSVMAGPLAAAP